MSSRRRQTPPPPRVPPPVQNQTDPRYTLSASGFPLPPRQTVIPTRFSQIQGPDAPTRFERCGLGQPGRQNAQDLVADADRVVQRNDHFFGTSTGSVNVIIFAL